MRALLFVSFSQSHPMDQAIYSSIFHAISAFCNAGFSLYTLSLMPFADNIMVNLTIMALIILGGLGFPVLYELINRIFHRSGWDLPRLSLHCKLVLITTAILIVSGTVFLYLFELPNPLHHDYKGLSVLEALFQSVTARNSGIQYGIYRAVDQSIVISDDYSYVYRSVARIDCWRCENHVFSGIYSAYTGEDERERAGACI